MSTLIRKGVLITILCVGMGLLASPARAQLGAAAGYDLNLETQPGFSSEAQNSLESTGGFTVGLFYNFPFGRVALRPGLFLNQSSFDWEILEENGEPHMFSPLESKLRVASIPFDIRFRFPGEQFSPYVIAGPGFNFIHTDQPDLRQVLDNPEGTTYYTSINIGAGIEVPVPGLGLLLLPEVRYSQALSGFLEENYIVRTISYAADGSQRMNSLTFRLGISFLSIR